MKTSIDQILKAINLASYENYPDDRVLVRFEYLDTLKKEVKRLQEEVKMLKEKNKAQETDIRNLTGKLIEQDLKHKNLDLYM